MEPDRGGFLYDLLPESRTLATVAVALMFVAVFAGTLGWRPYRRGGLDKTITLGRNPQKVSARSLLTTAAIGGGAGAVLLGLALWRYRREDSF